MLRWAFAGALIAVFVDLSDLFLMGWLDLGGLGNYQAFDKWLDLAYMVTFLIAALRWDGVERNVAVALFAFRMIGFLIFEITGARLVLLAFPNVFEFWFIGVAGRLHWFPDVTMTRHRVIGLLIICLILKMAQEWIVHGGQYLDNYVAIDLIENVWNWLSDTG